MVIWIQRTKLLSSQKTLIAQNMNTKVAILVRVSTSEQNTDRQLSELTGYADSKEYHIVTVETEIISGATKNDKRTAIQRILQLARANKIQKLLVHEVSRLGRDTAQVLATIEELHTYGVSVVVMNYQLETLNANGSLNSMAQFLLTLLTDIGRMERATLIERVKSGMAEAKRKGKTIGRPKNSTKDKNVILKEYKHVIKYLNDGQTVRNTATLAKVGISTVMRVKKLLEVV